MQQPSITKIAESMMHQITENNKELRRNALRELIKMYLSDYLSADQTEKLVEEYIP